MLSPASARASIRGSRSWDWRDMRETWILESKSLNRLHTHLYMKRRDRTISISGSGQITFSTCIRPSSSSIMNQFDLLQVSRYDISVYMT